MRFKQRFFVAVVVVFLPVAIIALMHEKPTYTPQAMTALLPVINEVRMTRSTDPVERVITLPFSTGGAPDEILNYHITLTYEAGESTSFWLIPDDCLQNLKVGQNDIALNDDADSHRCDWQEGFRIDLRDALVPGKNELFVRVLNKKGKTGLTFEPVL